MSDSASQALAPWREAFAGFSASLPEGERQPRADEFARFLERGFPTTRIEDWKYTDVSGLAERVYGSAPAAAGRPDLATYLLPGCDRLVLIDGRAVEVEIDSDPSAREIDSDPISGDRGDDAIAHLNRAFATGGAVLSLKRGEQRPRPLHVLVVTTAAADSRMTHLAHRFDLAAGAQADVLLEHIDLGTTTHFSTQRLDIRIERDARLRLTRLQREAAGTTHLFRCEAHVAEGAAFVACSIDLGGGLVRNDWIASLDGPRSEVRLDGVYAPTGSAHVDNHTRIDHRAPHGTSREFFRGLALDTARAVFNGKIVVHPGAQKTDSEQRVANLILSPKAEINAKPELEIYADDVKCAHGATFGQLDLTALFYLRSRGLPETDARALLTLAFAREPVRAISNVTIRSYADRLVARHLGGDVSDELTG